MAPHAKTFAKLLAGTNVELYCVMCVADYRRPVMMCSTDVIRMFAQLGASIGIDIYDFRELLSLPLSDNQS